MTALCTRTHASYDGVHKTKAAESPTQTGKSSPLADTLLALMSALGRKSQFSSRMWALKEQSMLQWTILHPCTYTQQQ